MKRIQPPSTRNLGALPEPDRLKALMQSVALLDEILCDDEESRYYSFDEKWARGEAVAWMRNGSGDQWCTWFGKPGLVLLGFDHEASPMTPYARKDNSLWPGLLEGFPDELRYALKEPAFEPTAVTFVIWRRSADDGYRIGNVTFPKRKGTKAAANDPDGSEHLLAILDGKPATYAAFARSYYDVKVDATAVKRIYDHATLNASTIQKLSPGADVPEILGRAQALGFVVQ